VMKKGKDKGLKKDVRGYWGDITVSPYLTFGIDADTRVKYMKTSGALSDSSTVNAKALETMLFADAGVGGAELHKLTEGLFEIYNKNTGTEQHRHHTVEVAMYNLFSYLWELETGKPYVVTKANDIYSGLGAEAGLKADLQEQAVREKIKSDVEKTDTDADADAVVEELPTIPEESTETPIIPPLPEPSAKTKTDAEIATEEAAEQAAARHKEEVDLAKAIHRAETIVDSLDGFTVKVLTGLPTNTLYSHASKYAGFFDAAFVSTRAVGCVGQEEFPKLLKSNGLLAVESCKFLTPLTKQQRINMDDKVLEMVMENNTREGNGTINKLPHPLDIVPRRKRDESQYDVLWFKKE